MIDNLLQYSLEEIKSGTSYHAVDHTHRCLVCGQAFQEGEMFPDGGRFYTAAKAARLHVEKEHGDMLWLLTSLDKRRTGLTDHQKDLLLLMASGLSDREIAGRTKTAAATVRHQRYVFREKAKQAKLYLALFELTQDTVKGNDHYNEQFLDVHHGARMVDDRYFITRAEEEKIIASVFSSVKPLKLKIFSAKEKKKIVILRRIATQFLPGRKYTEKEVNAILKEIYEDYATLRRYLIEYGFMKRSDDGREYWKNE